MCESYIGATEKSVARIRVSQAGQFIRSMFGSDVLDLAEEAHLFQLLKKRLQIDRE